MVEKQRKERADQTAAHKRRWEQETAERASRLNKGIRGLWDRLTGRYGKQARQNKQTHQQEIERLHRDIAEYMGMRPATHAHEAPEQGKPIDRERDSGPSR